MDRNGEVWRNDNMMSQFSDHHQVEMEFRKGSWTAEEDLVLANYVAVHGEGRWNALAQCAGLNRTGKSCRLRWLNYLRPDVRRGDITLEEQLLILELHCRWGNRWSKIAQQLPGRTDNEIKNYWRTRVQKHAKQLKCDVNSKQFKDALRNVWMPRLVEKIAAARGSTLTTTSSTSTTYQNMTNFDMGYDQMAQMPQPNVCSAGLNTYTSENSSAFVSSDSLGTVESDVTDCLNNYAVHQGNDQDCLQVPNELGYADVGQIGDINQWSDFTEQNSQWMNDGDHISDILWDVDDLWLIRQQFDIDV